MQAGEVIELTKQWVEAEGCRTPGFHGVHLMGSLVDMPRDATFPLWRDVDLSIVVPDGAGAETGGKENVDLLYNGLLLEVSFHELQKYSSPEVVLSDPQFAACFAADSVLSDPTGMLDSLRQRANGEYAHRRWVRARCGYERAKFLEWLEALLRADSPADAGSDLFWALGYVTGIVAVAHLRQPTHRRCLILMRELLEPHHRLDLCEETLNMMGWGHMTQPQVQTYLEEALRAFDRAVEVHRTPVPYGFKLHPHVRPYFAEGAREMICEGHHREAMWWILACYGIANAAIQNDAPDEETPAFQAGFDRLLEDMGLSTPEDWAARAEQARSVATKVFQVADEIVASNPKIAG